jgi:hypothetical protein
MMAGNGIFSLGLIAPLLLLFVGPVGIGLLCSVVAIVVRRRADSELSSGESQSQIDTSIALLAISALLSACSLIPTRDAVFGTGTTLAIIGMFLLWPVSAVLAIRGRGVGRKVLLVGHGLIAVWVLVLVLSILIHMS